VFWILSIDRFHDFSFLFFLFRSTDWSLLNIAQFERNSWSSRSADESDLHETSNPVSHVWVVATCHTTRC
jgi:hypothetical protein